MRAAGGVVRRRVGRLGRRHVEVILIHRPRYDDWSFPKGKLDDGEGFEAAALREVEEETGLACRLVADLGETRYADRRGREKVVRYWLMEEADPAPEEAGFVPNRRGGRGALDAAGEAATLLTYPHDRSCWTFFPGAADRHERDTRLPRATRESGQPQPLGRPRPGPAPQQGRPAPGGRARHAARRPAHHAHRPSPYVRCHQTVVPLASASPSPSRPPTC